MSRKCRICILIFLLMVASNITAQDVTAIPIGCGTILDNEVLAGQEYNSTGENYPHRYAIHLAPGDALSVIVTPYGNAINVFFRLFDPAGGAIYSTGPGAGPGQPDIMQNYVVSATGTYILAAGGFQPGAYTLSVGCILRNGTPVPPGATGGSTTPVPPVSEDGIFISTDFSQVARLPLPPGIAMGGAVTATGDEIIGYAVNTNAGDKLDLSFTRASGNLNLGLVVLSSDNNVIYMAALVTSETMTTRFAVPAAGEYTIGIFRLDLLPPPDPQPTAFQIQVGVNAP